MLNTLISRRQARSNFVQEDLVKYTIPLDQVRQTGDLTALPVTEDGTNFVRTSGVHGTASPILNSSDYGITTETNKGRFLFVLPPEYVSGQTVTLRLHAKSSAAPNVSATIDAEVYESDGEAGISADLCATAAQDCSSTSYADYDFVITPTALVAGDVLDIEITTVGNNTGGTGAIQFLIGVIEMLLDIKG